ncbi:B12-binding domain-containing radical SAM protein [Geomobilimonas luticola]|uniref:B12-binding domain-containing radical SAM protein n=1 Tax=Geomobilimonas luticola TaxID=1114878 RepID=A0ABS5SGN7_9BACT|nr:radical SAM protein [Geomobilimonas luticola]MBT0654520.1 B12-binding domain-containing radical SAM protein [Geomobilimonas luticola]
MKVALIGAELEENLGLRYMVSALEQAGHRARIFPFNDETELATVVRQIAAFAPHIAGLSMVFTGRAREFCRLARSLRESGFAGHLTAGGHFAALNCRQLMQDFPEFDSIALGEGEKLICELAANLSNLSDVPGFCYRDRDRTIRVNPSAGNPEELDLLPFPRRDTFHEYYGKPIASILSSRGCWRSCAFCSIDAWYRSGGGSKFRIRSVPNIVAEMSELYHGNGVRIFNFQDDNFFLPDRAKALARFTELRDSLWREGVKDIAIAVKARPDSINREAMSVLDDLGVFRVFLGVENASERELENLNRKCSRDAIENALHILNDVDVHVAYNLLMFEPDTTLEDILINLRFMERHMDNPFNFCRAEAYAATGLEKKLRRDGILVGDYFGFDYRIKDPHVEAFHKIANYAFFDRNFNDFGLHYFNMEVDFSFQLLRRFHPDLLSQELRSEVRSFIKETNIDTYRCLSRIWDMVQAIDPADQETLRNAMGGVRLRVDDGGIALRARGERILERLRRAWVEQRPERADTTPVNREISLLGGGYPYFGRESLANAGADPVGPGFFGGGTPIPYAEFRRRLAEQK